MPRFIPIALFMLGMCCWLGCGDADSQSSTSGGNTTGAAELLEMKIIEAASLPKVGDPITPTGFAKLSICRPEDWGIGARPKADDNYLVRFMKDPAKRIPCMEFRVNPNGKLEGFSSVNAENVQAYAEAVQATLKSPKENARAMMIGKNAFVRYVKTATYKNDPIDVQVLVTIQNDQPFILEMQVPEGKIPEFRDAGYTVAANISFNGSNENTEPAPEATPKEEPAEEAKLEK